MKSTLVIDIENDETKLKMQAPSVIAPSVIGSQLALTDLEWDDFSDKRRDPPKSDCIYRICLLYTSPSPRDS